MVTSSLFLKNKICWYSGMGGVSCFSSCGFSFTLTTWVPTPMQVPLVLHARGMPQRNVLHQGDPLAGAREWQPAAKAEMLLLNSCTIPEYVPSWVAVVASVLYFGPNYLFDILSIAVLIRSTYPINLINLSIWYCILGRPWLVVRKSLSKG